MQISGEYGTELLLRYSEAELAKQLEFRRVAVERAEESGGSAGRSHGGAGPWFARLARFFSHQNTAAGGPVWIRPDRGQTALPESIAAPVVAQAPASPVPALVPSHVAEWLADEDVDERMPVPALVEQR